jgi:hypothetical protein
MILLLEIQMNISLCPQLVSLYVGYNVLEAGLAMRFHT